MMAALSGVDRGLRSTELDRGISLFFLSSSPLVAANQPGPGVDGGLGGSDLWFAWFLDIFVAAVQHHDDQIDLIANGRYISGNDLRISPG